MSRECIEPFLQGCGPEGGGWIEETPTIRVSPVENHDPGMGASGAKEIATTGVVSARCPCPRLCRRAIPGGPKSASSSYFPLPNPPAPLRAFALAQSDTSHGVEPSTASYPNSTSNPSAHSRREKPKENRNASCSSRGQADRPCKSPSAPSPSPSHYQFASAAPFSVSTPNRSSALSSSSSASIRSALSIAEIDCFFVQGSRSSAYSATRSNSSSLSRAPSDAGGGSASLSELGLSSNEEGERWVSDEAERERQREGRRAFMKARQNLRDEARRRRRESKGESVDISHAATWREPRASQMARRFPAPLTDMLGMSSPPPSGPGPPSGSDVPVDTLADVLSESMSLSGTPPEEQKSDQDSTPDGIPTLNRFDSDNTAVGLPAVPQVDTQPRINLYCILGGKWGGGGCMSKPARAGRKLVIAAIELTDAQDLLSTPLFPDLAAHLDLWTNVNFASDEPFISARDRELKESETEVPHADSLTRKEVAHSFTAPAPSPVSADALPQSHQFDFQRFLAEFGIPPPNAGGLNIQTPSGIPQPSFSSSSFGAVPAAAPQSTIQPAHTIILILLLIAHHIRRSPRSIRGGSGHSTPLTAAEDKRRRNTAASARFRLKKKEREAALDAKAHALEERVASLERECEGLRRENGWLRGLRPSAANATAAATATTATGAEKRKRDEESA
ncbi:Basic region leucine zipper [Rhizoctonia solani]|uniref:Basic region leucine zipper n=1 Tax=Rhizoctonia solani TaxID=456999 RepID=A0A8H7IGS0_9AGAM|nr:Basic region leucine zipper [Rhizoctonia solani]